MPELPIARAPANSANRAETSERSGFIMTRSAEIIVGRAADRLA
jgi:hypothetical protein